MIRLVSPLTRLILASCLSSLAAGCGSSSSPSLDEAGALGGSDDRDGDQGPGIDRAADRGDGSTADSRENDGAGSEAQVACGNGFCPSNQICCSGCAGAPDFCATSTCPDAPCRVTIDASPTDAASAAARFTCGTMNCAAAEICVHPGCGGGVAICDPPDDADACPTGWTRQPICFRPGGPPGPGCAPPACTPPAPYCLSRPAGCPGSGITCVCLPFNVCNGPDGGGVNGGSCAFVGQRDVTCGFQ